MPRLGPREGLDAVGGERQTDAGVANAGPWQPRAHAVAAVPVRRSGVHLRENAPRALLVPRVDARGQPVFGVVHERHGLLIARHLLDTDDRPEALVLHQAHAVVDLREDGGLEPVALALESVAAGEQFRALTLRVGDLAFEDPELRASGDCADIGRFV